MNSKAQPISDSFRLQYTGGCLLGFFVYLILNHMRTGVFSGKSGNTYKWCFPSSPCLNYFPAFLCRERQKRNFRFASGHWDFAYRHYRSLLQSAQHECLSLDSDIFLSDSHHHSRNYRRPPNWGGQCHRIYCDSAYCLQCIPDFDAAPYYGACISLTMKNPAPLVEQKTGFYLNFMVKTRSGRLIFKNSLQIRKQSQQEGNI